jgi:hypothetical protein
MKRALLILLAAALLLPLCGVAIFYGHENWAGDQAWEKAEAALRAAGEPLDFDAMQPKPIPDADNMAAAPIFLQLFTLYSPQRAEVYTLRLPPPATAKRTDSPLLAMARRFHAGFSGDSTTAAQVILDGLAPMEPMLNAIRRAAQRPGAVWPAANDGRRTTPFLPPLRQTAEVLAAHAVAALSEDDTERALADFELITRLAGDANQTPLIAGCLTEQAMLGCAMHIVREGLAQNAWSETDLVRIEETLARFKPLESFADSVRGERALFLTSPEQAYQKAQSLFTFIDFRSPTSEWISSSLCQAAWDLRPSGWQKLDRASYATFAQDWLRHVLRKGFVRPWALDDWNARLRAMRRAPTDFFRTPVTAFAMATYPPAARTAAYTQTGVDLARLACAIERHRLATGRAPETLANLAPQWIDSVPRDAVTGSSYFYRSDNGDDYILYGKGWNARDDGGSSANVNVLLGPSSADDWVWQTSRRWKEQASSN